MYFPLVSLNLLSNLQFLANIIEPDLLSSLEMVHFLLKGENQTIILLFFLIFTNRGNYPSFLKKSNKHYKTSVFLSVKAPDLVIF